MAQTIEDKYRKVTVMPALGKVFKYILNSRLKYINTSQDFVRPVKLQAPGILISHNEQTKYSSEISF